MSFFSKPKYAKVSVQQKKEIPDLWTKCPKTGQTFYNRELEANAMVVPNEERYHFPLSAPARMDMLLDKGSFVEEDAELRSTDPLNFKGAARYAAKLEQYQKKTGLADAVLSGHGKIEGCPVQISVMDFRFLGASMGSVVGEKITRCIERGLERGEPVIVVSASGGARMYEGILSLMQMAKTSAALAKLSQAGIPFISVLTNPTMAGVMASFASLGDLILAEPGALIGFAGPRVIKDTTQAELPEGFQTSEFLIEHGFIDQIVDRHDMRDRLAFFLKSLTANKASA